MTSPDLMANCRHCGQLITRTPGGFWCDVAGMPACVKAGIKPRAEWREDEDRFDLPVLHEPMPDGLPGAERYPEWASRDAFWLDDARRWLSPESDYGVMWRDGQCRWPLWRVSYVRDTGEVYAHQQGGQGRVRLLGWVPPDPVADPDRETYYRTLDVVLAGWENPDVTGWQLSWVAARLAEREG